ncbi:Pr6Pr family membrane protein, partial [Actinoplanes sp. NPDC024001]|uniref:Pr6Pr family membrane protein n=1 Tax=Actinoplanes sp. NPDC024001 TaxID=3154598 RepID=UPI0033F290D3
MSVYASPQWWWRLLIVAAGMAGLYSGSYSVVAYTTQSALIVIGYYAGVLYWMARRRTVDAAAPRLRAAVMSWILLSGLVAHFVLAGGENPLLGLTATGTADLLGNWSHFLLHYALPAMVFLDWLVFRPYGAARWGDLVGWMLFPLGYAGVVLARGALFPSAGFRYPYPFLSPEFQGWTGVGSWILGLAISFAAIGTALISIDRLRAPASAPQRSPSSAPADQHGAQPADQHGAQPA